MAAKLGVIVVNYASHHLIERNLRITGDLTVVVVDNFSTDAERAAMVALARARGWTCVRSENHGFGDGANAGVSEALSQGCEAVVIANPDLEIDSVQASQLAMAALDSAGIVAPLVVSPDGEPWGQLGTVDVRAGRVRSRVSLDANPSWISGACLAVSASTWRCLGGFSKDYFMYWEDVDLSVRCQRAGGSVIVLDQITVVHEVGGTQGLGRSRLYYYYNCRNRLVFAARNLTAGQQLRWLLLTPGDVRRVARRDVSLSRRQRVVKAVPACLRGVAAGVGWMVAHNLRRRSRRS